MNPFMVLSPYEQLRSATTFFLAARIPPPLFFLRCKSRETSPSSSYAGPGPSAMPIPQTVQPRLASSAGPDPSAMPIPQTVQPRLASSAGPGPPAMPIPQTVQPRLATPYPSCAGPGPPAMPIPQTVQPRPATPHPSGAGSGPPAMPIPQTAQPRSPESFPRCQFRGQPSKCLWEGQVVLRCQFRKQLAPPKHSLQAEWICDANSVDRSAQLPDWSGRVVLRCHIPRAGRSRSVTQEYPAIPIPRSFI